MKSKGGEKMICIASMRSMTYAMKARRVLAAGGVNCEITSIDPSLTRHGCAYGLKFDCHGEGAVRELLQAAGMRSFEIIGVRL